MKKFFFFAFCLLALHAWSQVVSPQKAQIIATSFMAQHQLSGPLQPATPYTDNGGTVLYYYLNASPHQFVVVSASELTAPVLAYSSQSFFYPDSPFAWLLAADIKNRMAAAPSLTNQNKIEITQQWMQLMDGNNPDPKFQQWPPAGSTSTEGWVETNWTQSSPYNQMCPMDPVSSTRSFAGCPAVAMGQIINYLKTTQNTRFDDGDDYTHDYAGRNYLIDDDADSLDFPSFPELNAWLDSVDILFQSGSNATTQTAAALVFACGTACTQVYTSSGSGTFSVNQAYAAYQRFGFLNAQLLTTTDSSMYNALISNMQNGYPAHLAVVDSAWSVGHNVVVDGYNTDGFFHINFGWGGAYNGWWLVPDPTFPYSMGVLEGIILDIIPIGAGIPDVSTASSVTVFPNPAHDVVYVKNLSGIPFQYTLFSMSGQTLQSGNTTGSISLKGFPAGLYMLNIQSETMNVTRKFLIEY